MIESQEPKKKTLTDFVEVNGKLISLLGGFAGLAAVAQKMPDFVKLSIRDTFILKMIPFLLFILAINTFVEIMRNFRGYYWYGEVFLFRTVFFLVMVCFVWVFVRAYYPILTVLLLMSFMLIVMILLLAFCLYITKTGFTMSWFDGVGQKTKDTLTNLISPVLFIGTLVVAYFLAHHL